MVKAILLLVFALINFALAAFLQNRQEADLSAAVGLYCVVLAIVLYETRNKRRANGLQDRTGRK